MRRKLRISTLETSAFTYGRQFILLTQLIDPVFCVSLPHRCNTTVSLEIIPLVSSEDTLSPTTSQQGPQGENLYTPLFKNNKRMQSAAISFHIPYTDCY